MSETRFSTLLQVVWACIKKDTLTAITEWIFLVTTLLIPLQYLTLLHLFVFSADHAPTAVVMHESGPYAKLLYHAMNSAHSFRLILCTTQEAQDQLATGKIVAIVTIPADFDTRVQQQQPVEIPVQINNINTDMTADIRRAVPLSITSFYSQAFPTQVGVAPRERDWYAQDTDYTPYVDVALLVLGLALGAAIQSGTAWAREWELETMQELLLSPASRWCLVVGKMLAAFVLALFSAGIVFLILIGPLETRPAHPGEMFGYTLLTLIIFSAFGTLLGTVVKQRRLITTIVLGSSLPVFFVSGPLSPVTFSTPAIQFIAQIFPVTYAIAGEQHAFHGYDTNTLGACNALVLAGFALVFTGAAVLMLRRTVTHS